MTLFDRFKKGINAYIKNDAKAAAIASVITNKDCSADDIVRTNGFDRAVLGLLPLLKKDLRPHDKNPLSEAILKVLRQKTLGRIFFILCGPSAVGKDTLASYTKHNLYLERINISYADKYTTRKRRGYEGLIDAGSHEEPSNNYRYFDDKNDLKAKITDAALDYSIYDNYYAFSGNHLLSTDEIDRVLLCIYGRFENMQAIRNEVFLKYNRIPFSILLTAPSDDLDNRTFRRHVLSAVEQGKRSKEMKKQISFIERNEELIRSNFDIIIENGDKNTVHNSQMQLTTFIKTSIELANKALSADS